MQKQTISTGRNQQGSSAATINATVERIRSYDYGRRRTDLVALEKLINATHGNEESRTRIEAALMHLLESSATRAAKQFACKKLWTMGTDASVPVLAGLLAGSDQVLVEAACYALRSQPSEDATRALRESLGKARGLSLVAIINVIGDRKDPLSAASLTDLARSQDELVADAAIAALGKIATPEAVQALSALQAEKNRRALSAAHALLQSGQELTTRGDKDAARRVYAQLKNSTDVPQIRRGAELALRRFA